MRTNRRTDMTKLIVAFRNFEKAHKKFLLVEINSEVQDGRTTSRKLLAVHSTFLTHSLP